MAQTENGVQSCIRLTSSWCHRPYEIRDPVHRTPPVLLPFPPSARRGPSTLRLGTSTVDETVGSLVVVEVPKYNSDLLRFLHRGDGAGFSPLDEEPLGQERGIRLIGPLESVRGDHEDIPSPMFWDRTRDLNP